jgi:hypothetical protein
MTNDEKKANDAGPGGVPLRDSTGIAGPSREVSQTDNAVPGAGAAGPVNDELKWAKKHVPGKRTVRKPARPVFRKTELLGIAPPTEPEAIKKARQRTMKNIRDPDGTIAYRPFEDAFRDFVCSLMERQERVYDEMLLHVADLQQQIDMLGDRLEETRRVSSGNAEVKG